MKRDKRIGLQNYLKENEKENQVLLVQGARQVGKSTLITEELSSIPHLAFNLETDRITRAEIDATKNFNEFTLFLKTKFNFQPGQTLFIDEVQESSQIGNYVREMKEVWKTSKVILTGSSINKLFSDDTRVPVGRIKFITIHPFSFREFLRWQNIENWLDEAIELKEIIPDFLHEELLKKFNDFCTCGGLPEAVKAYPNDEYKSVLTNILLAQKEDFLKKEREEPYLFLDALKGVANHVGYPSKLTHISSNFYQAKKISEKLQNWHLLYLVNVQGHSSTSAFSQKRYLYDLGILKSVRNAPTPDIKILETLREDLRQPLGGIIENSVLLNYLSETETPIELSTWKKNPKQPVEVDFVFEIQNKKIPIEVKAALKFKKQMCKNILTYLNLYQQKDGIVISLAKYQEINIDNFKIVNIPAYMPLVQLSAPLGPQENSENSPALQENSQKAAKNDNKFR